MTRATIDQDAVLARWRETRSPRLADVLCCVPVDDEWDARLEHLASLVATKAGALPRVPLLPDDPRTTLFLMRQLAEPNWWGPNGRPLWTHIFERLVKLRDVRCIPQLREFARTPPRFFQPKMTKWVATECARVAEALAKLKLPKDDAKTVKLAEAQKVTPPKGGFFAVLTTQDVDSLLAQVWAAPDDMELRAVIGDALQELGDPRGELIALQLARRPNAKAIAKLLDEHAEALAGPLGRMPPHSGNFKGQTLWFVAGFLDAIVVGTYFGIQRDWDEAAVAPHWATVRRVRFAGQTPKRKWFKSWWESGQLGSLREIAMQGLGARSPVDVVLERDAADAPWKITRTPSEFREIELTCLTLLLATMPRKQLARVAIPPATHPLAQLVGSILGTCERPRGGP